MPPNPRPIPRFIADTTQEGIPHGRFAERLARGFREACEEIEDLPDGRRGARRGRLVPRARLGRPGLGPGYRAHRGRRRARWSCSATSPTCCPRAASPTDFRAKADFTDVLAEDNPDWRIDLNDDVIGRWRGENGRAGAVTLVWGRPLVRGAVAATAELDGETVDQEAISDERFTLIALDALEGYGDDIFIRSSSGAAAPRSWPPRASTTLAPQDLRCGRNSAGPDSSAG